MRNAERLREMSVNAVEVQPVTEFGTWRSWVGLKLTTGGEEFSMVLTPEEARQLVRGLRRVLDQVENEGGK